MKMPRKRRPNYMKPTASSDAKSEKPQVTTIHSLTPRNLNHMNDAKPSNSSHLSPSINKTIRATCSSTLKNSKFPQALELHPGGTEAQGTSTMRICRYDNCSLNDQCHEPLPPLKSLILARKKLLNTQRSFKLKGLPLFKVKGSVKDEEEIVDDLFFQISAKLAEFHDLHLQSFGGRNTQNELNHTHEYYSDMHLGDDLDVRSGLSIEEMDSMLRLLEYVEFDETIEAGGEVKEGREPTDMPTLNATCLNWGEEEESITSHKSNFSHYPYDFLGPVSWSPSPKETVADKLSFEPSSGLCEMTKADAEQSIELVKLETKQNSEDEILDDGSEEVDTDDAEVIEEPTINHQEKVHSSAIDQSDQKIKDNSWVRPSTKEPEEASYVEGSIRGNTKQDSIEIHEVKQTEDDNYYDRDDIQFLSSKERPQEKTINTETTNTKHPLEFTFDVPKAKMKITRKMTTEEAEQMREFNPRSPRFLPIEPEPEAEIIDLRHQTTEEGKNSEEWMIDYALRNVISKMEPARKRKVALLVKAFETVIPLSMPEEPLTYAISSFAHPRIMQHCS